MTEYTFEELLALDALLEAQCKMRGARQPFFHKLRTKIQQDLLNAARTRDGGYRDPWY